MSDLSLLLFGIVVFGLMLVGAVLTVIEFRRLTNEDKSGSEPGPPSPDSAGRPQIHG